MRIAVTGSIAIDHLGTFPGKFAEQLIAEQLERVSLSFLLDSLEVRYGGVGANIATGLGRLGVRTTLVGAAGRDFADYRAWLAGEGVDTDPVLVRADEYTARFWCTTDQAQNQIATFHPGAMTAAREIDLSRALHPTHDVRLVVIGANDPAAMARHTDDCRTLGLPFAADPSQQLAALDGPAIRQLVEGARYLFTNEYEHTLLLQKTGWTEQQVRDRVGVWITTLAERGARIDSAEGWSGEVPAVPARELVDPTGAGDGFRAGFIAGLTWKLPYPAAAQLGCMLATIVLEAQGTVAYELDLPTMLERIADTYGAPAAARFRPYFGAANLNRRAQPTPSAVRP